jgi:hypothetical protein
MPGKFLLLFSASSLLTLVPLRVGAIGCPSYPYPPTTVRCWQDGFCVWDDLEARTIEDGMPEQDDPSEAFTVQAAPVMFDANAAQGSGDLFGLVDSDGEAGRSFVRAASDGHAAASCCKIPTSASTEADTLSVMRVTDLVISGPTADVEATLHLVFDASSSQVTMGVENATAISSISALVSGAICGGMEFMTFRGEKTYTLQDASGMDDLFAVSVNTGVLRDVSLDAATEIEVGPFTVPTGVPLKFELWMQTALRAATGGGDADSALDFALFAGPPEGGLVFELPAGYSADSVQAGIVASSTAVPEVGAAAMTLVGGSVLWLAARSRRPDGAVP